MRYAPTIIRPISVRANRIRPFAYALSHTPKITLLHYYNITCNIFWLVVWFGFRTKTQIPYQITTHKKNPPALQSEGKGIFDVMTKHLTVWLLLYKGSYARCSFVVYLHNVCTRYKCRYINSCGIAYSFLLKHNAFGRIYLHSVTAGLM